MKFTCSGPYRWYPGDIPTVSPRHSPLNGWISPQLVPKIIQIYNKPDQPNNKPTSTYHFGTGLSSPIKMLTWGWCRWLPIPSVLQQHGWGQHPAAFLHVSQGVWCFPQRHPRARRQQGLPGNFSARKIWDWTKNKMSILGRKMVLLSQLCFFYIYMFVSFCPHLCYSNLYCLSPDLPFKLLPNQKIRLLHPPQFFDASTASTLSPGAPTCASLPDTFCFWSRGARDGAIPGHTSETCLALPGKNIRCLPANRYIYIL